MRLLVLLLAGLLQSPPASVEGVAIKAGTTEPVARARVMLTSVEGRLADTRVVDTDERGRFAFRGVAAGTYRIVAQHDTFVRATARPVTIASGQSIRDLVIAMTPTGVITGRVVDEYGDPVPDVYVRASLKESVFETTTNDLGEYRLFGLPPGAYIVNAAPYLTPWIERDATASDGLQTGRVVVPTRPSPYSPGEGRGLTPLAPLLRAGNFIPFMALRGESHTAVYYPGTTDATAAAPIEVSAGAVVGGINFVTKATKSTK
jgi:hypothetical protein